jgi:ketosteroid isomerase-like protein
MEPMKIRHLGATSAALLIFSGAGAVTSPAAPESVHEPIAVVDAFQQALLAGDIARAASYLDPDVVILESGGAEWSAQEYLSGHARADVDFLKAARITPGARSARVEGNLAWVASLVRFETEREGKPVVIDGAETMVLRLAADGWKIVHIHWSSRAGP